MNTIQQKIRNSSRVAFILALIVLAFTLLITGNQVIQLVQGIMGGHMQGEMSSNTYLALDMIFVIMQIANVAAVYFVTRIFYEISREGKPFDMYNVKRLKLSSIAIVVYGIFTIVSDSIINYAYGAKTFLSIGQVFNGLPYGYFIVGAMIFVLALFFEYGCQLQQQSDETL